MAGIRLTSNRPRGIIYCAIFLLSAATLCFEINLTRLYSIAQFYHFAFMIVSLALLGYGASGSILYVFPNLGKKNPSNLLEWSALLGGVSMLGAYSFINYLPFDSFVIAIQPQQFILLGLHFMALSMPFFFNGLAVGFYLKEFPQGSNRTYAANLLGSAAGCLIVMWIPSIAGGEGVVLFSGTLAAVSAFFVFIHLHKKEKVEVGKKRIFGFLIALFLLFSTIQFTLRLGKEHTSQWFDLHLSPYKGLSYALQYPGAKIISSTWNSFSRVDIVESPGMRSLPGLSYRYQGSLPAEKGLYVDGDDMNPILDKNTLLSVTDYLPQTAAYQLRPRAKTLVLEPRGGLDIVIALAQGAGQVTAVEPNPLSITAASHIYQDSKVITVNESARSFLKSNKDIYDVIILSLTSAFHPVSSGAYSLAEDYRYTTEAWIDMLEHLTENGILVVNRWLQMPPSEELRAFALAVAALDKLNLRPDDHLVAFRGYNLTTLLIKKSPFTQAELTSLNQFTSSHAFDLIYAPGIHPEDTNRFNILKESVYYKEFSELLQTKSRADWFRQYPYDVSPPTDDHPFFGHFYKWSQLNEIIAGFGKTWQPFGGAGYVVILALLLLTIILSTLLILTPILFRKTRIQRNARMRRSSLSLLGFFFFVGFGFMLVEMPLFQRFILFLGQPAYALTAVLFTLLSFSGLGSICSRKIKLTFALICLIGLITGFVLFSQDVFDIILGISFPLRLAFTIALLAPTGFLMGIALPNGILLAERTNLSIIPWLWGVNGAASVIASVSAAILALTFGFKMVLWLGAGCYLCALLIIRRVWARAGGLNG